MTDFSEQLRARVAPLKARFDEHHAQHKALRQARAELVRGLQADFPGIPIHELVEHLTGSTAADCPPELKHQIDSHLAEHRGRIASLATKHGVANV